MADTLSAFREEMKRMLGTKTIDVDAPMSQIGVDSLNIVEMVIICQQIYIALVDYEDIEMDRVYRAAREGPERVIDRSGPQVVTVQRLHV